MNKKIMSIAIIVLLGVSLLSFGLVKNNSFASGMDNKVKLTKEDARELVLGQYKDGKVQKVKLDYEDGKLVYEIDLVVNGVEHDIDIDANSGKILKDKVDDYDDCDDSTISQFAKITVDQVKTIVMDKYKDGVITEIDLENEDGNILYEVEVNTKDGERDIKVDARTGKILIDQLDD